MDNVERGLKIIDIFTDLREHVNKIGGYIDQRRGSVYENPSCGTAACIGGWLADYFATKVIYFGGGHRIYIDGYRELAHSLDVNCVANFVSESGLWHNDQGPAVFWHDSPYHRSEPHKISLDDVCADWVQFGYELVTKGGNNE